MQTMRTCAGRGLRMGLPAVLCALLAAKGAAQRSEPLSPTLAPTATVAHAAAPAATNAISIDAQALDYDRATGWAVGTGGVVVRQGEQELRADRVRVNANTGEAIADGNITLRQTRNARPWKGASLKYNFHTRESSAIDMTGVADPFYITSKDSRRLPDGRYESRNATVSTCTNAPGCQHYHVRLREVTVTPDEQLIGRGATLYLGPLPYFYLPYWHRDLTGQTGFRFRPGYSSRMGAFLLSSYYYPLSDILRGETHLDLRSERGVALGQDIKWQDPGNQWRGSVKGYWLDDNKALDDGEDPATSDVSNERYRVRFKQENTLGERDYLIVNGDYVSDPDLLEDFYGGEYRHYTQPENYAVYTYRADRYTANLEARARLNDFYDDLDRLPQVSVSIPRGQILESPFYYGGQSAAGFLQKRWAARSAKEEYSAFRLDTEHAVYRPEKVFGFLNVTPRAGYRATYYSETGSQVATTSTSQGQTTNTTVNANGTVTTTVKETTMTNSVTRWVARGADVRSLFELGTEVSYKAFKAWEGGAVSPLRHVVEPYANYTLVPEPNLMPDDLYQFDGVDKLGDQNNVKLGVRNKFQTKQDNQAFDLIDLDVYTYYRFNDEYGTEKGLDDFFADLDFRPSSWLRIEMDARYDTDQSEIRTFNTQVTVAPEHTWKAQVEHRFRLDESSLLSGDFTFFPTRHWDYNVYGRQEFEVSRLEEVGGHIQRNLDCMHIRVGAGFLPGYTRTDGTPKDDEWIVRLELWLVAFPNIGVGDRHDE